jgi:hypothetical protein
MELKTFEDTRGEMHEIEGQARKSGAEQERRAIIAGLEAERLALPKSNDLHTIMGIDQGFAQCIAHILRRK